MGLQNFKKKRNDSAPDKILIYRGILREAAAPAKLVILIIKKILN